MSLFWSMILCLQKYFCLLKYQCITTILIRKRFALKTVSHWPIFQSISKGETLCDEALSPCCDLMTRSQLQSCLKLSIQAVVGDTCGHSSEFLKC